MIQPERALLSWLRPGACFLLVALVVSGPPALSQAAGRTTPTGAPAVKKAYYLLVFNNPYTGEDADYDQYYDEIHIPEMLTTPGVVSAQRFVSADQSQPPSQDSPRRYMAMYRVETDDIAATYRDFWPRQLVESQDQGASSASHVDLDAMRNTPVDSSTTFSVTYEVLGSEISGAGPKKTGRGEMKTYYFCAQSSPMPGKDKEFNDWYNKQHGPEMAATPGIVSAQRFRRSAVQRGNAGPSPQYLIMYKIVTDDLASIFDDINRRAKSFPANTTQDATKSEHFTYQALGPVVTLESLRATAANQ